MMTDNQPKERGRFITFEGIDGAGKSSHIEHVRACLAASKIEVVLTREPGGTETGEKLRDMLLNRSMDPLTELLLMFAARREHVVQVIEPALKEGKWVLSDRFTDASWAYQGGGRGITGEKLAALENWVQGQLQPDMTFLFDVSPEVAKSRLEAVRSPDKFEREKALFFNNVRKAYLDRANAYQNRFRVIDSSRTIEAIRVELDRYISALVGANR